MSDARLPPPAPEEIEGDDAGPDHADPAVAGEGPALIVPPLPEPSESERESKPDDGRR